MAFGTLTPYRRASLLAREPRFGTGSLLFDLQRQMNHMFDEVFDSDSPRQFGGSYPLMDVSQDDKKIEICAELPGVKQEDIDINVEDGVLTLSGEKKCERRDENGYTERSYGRFERRITLPSNIDDERCEAEFKDGLLRITIPKSEAKSRGRRIPLGSAGKAKGASNAESALIDQGKK
jgi:HSP20 family protein